MNATNRGFQLMCELLLHNRWLKLDDSVVAVPTQYFWAIVRSTSQPTFETVRIGSLTEVSGGIYPAGGFALTLNNGSGGSAPFPDAGVQEDDALDRALVTAADFVLDNTAGGTDINDCTYIVLTDNSDTQASGNRQVLCWFPVTGGSINVLAGQIRRFQNGKQIATPSGWTNRGMKLMLNHTFNRHSGTGTGEWMDKNGNSITTPASFKITAITDTSFNPDWNTLNVNDPGAGTGPHEVTGGGYVAGGQNLTRDLTGIISIVRSDVTDKVTFLLRDILISADGSGPINGIRQILLTDNAATVTDRQVLMGFPVSNGPHNIPASTTSTFPLCGGEIRQS